MSLKKNSLAIAYAVKRKAQNKAMGGMVHDEDYDMEEPVHSDNNFLSSEDGGETPFGNQGMSDSEELQESGFEPAAQMDNEQGNEDQAQSRRGMLSNIMQRLHRKHMGRY